MFRLIAAAVLTAGMMAAAVVTGMAPASAGTAASASAAAARPVAGKAPLKDLIGRPVRHVTPPVTPGKSLRAPEAVRLPAGERAACPAPKPGRVSCGSIIRTGPVKNAAAGPAVRSTSGGTAAGTVKAGTDAAAASGYSPAQLQSAYNLTTAAATGGIANGAPVTVAISTPYDDPDAAADLAAYRAQFGQAPCITTANVANYSLPLGSGCVTKVNEDNQASPLPSAPPAASGDWTETVSAEIDMISAACPNCEILLSEADGETIADAGQSLVTAENDADIVLAGWSAYEFAGETADDHAYLNAPGKALVTGAGDEGFVSEWPAASQYVTAVGGTTLTADASTSRGYTETAWSSGSAACATFEAKPSWQPDTGTNGCPNRTENDTAAVGDPATPVAIYDSTAPANGDGRTAGWVTGASTVTASALIAGIYALNGLPRAGTYPASYPYQAGASGDFNDVTSGSDGTCESNRQYLCNAVSGYDGPTGMGTPKGPAGLSDQASGGTVTVPDPGTQDYGPGEKVSIPLQASSSDPGQAITWTAAGLPDGLSINSATGAVTGTLTSAADSTATVTATATDAAGASGTASFRIVTTGKLSAGWTAVTGPVSSGVSGKCLDDTNGSTTAGNQVQSYACNSETTQNWQYQPGDDPGQGGAIQYAASTGLCLAAAGLASGSKVTLQKCDGDDKQAWIAESNEAFVSPSSGLCLTNPGDSTTDGSKLDVEACTSAAGQEWAFPASEITSGITGDCLDDYQNNTANGTPLDLAACTNAVGQKWIPRSGNTLHVNSHCLDLTAGSTLDGAAPQIYACNNGVNQTWTITPAGEIISLVSGKCLADPGDSTTAGTKLVQEDCQGNPGEIWEAS